MNVVHIVAVDPHHCRFGDTHQPRCLNCSYVGPFVSEPRAKAIAAEHRRKSVDAWRPAK